MDITPYVEALRRDLLSAAEAAGTEARETAERLGYALDPAVRLAIMEAVSQAAAEITAELPAGNVDVRLQGRELEFGVTMAPPQVPMTPPMAPKPPAPPEPPLPPGPEEAPEPDNLARITLRLPESLKVKAEAAAADAGQSLNTWLVNAVRSATRDEFPGVADLGSIPQLVNDAMQAAFDPMRTPGRSNRRMSGWL